MQAKIWQEYSRYPDTAVATIEKNHPSFKAKHRHRMAIGQRQSVGTWTDSNAEEYRISMAGQSNSPTTDASKGKIWLLDDDWILPTCMNNFNKHSRCVWRHRASMIDQANSSMGEEEYRISMIGQSNSPITDVSSQSKIWYDDWIEPTRMDNFHKHSRSVWALATPDKYDWSDQQFHESKGLKSPDMNSQQGHDTRWSVLPVLVGHENLSI